MQEITLPSGEACFSPSTSADIVAFAMHFGCDKSMGPLYSDAATTHTGAQHKGELVFRFGLDCPGTVTSLILADGSVHGIPADTQYLLNDRRFVWQELHGFIQEKVPSNRLAVWDSDESIAWLKKRLPVKTPSTQESGTKRMTVLRFIESLEDYQAHLAKAPARQAQYQAWYSGFSWNGKPVWFLLLTRTESSIGSGLWKRT